MPVLTNSLPRLALVACVALLVACGTIDDIISSNAQVDYKKGYEFGDIKTVTVNCSMDIEAEDAPLTQGQIDRVDAAVIRALEGRGMNVVEDDSNADAMVRWHVVTQEQSSLREYNADSYYQCWRCGPAISSASTVTYTEGTFVVDIIDKSLNKSVWRGVMKGRLAEVRDGNVQQMRFDKAAREMLAKFPPGILIDGIY